MTSREACQAEFAMGQCFLNPSPFHTSESAGLAIIRCSNEGGIGKVKAKLSQKSFAALLDSACWVVAEGQAENTVKLQTSTPMELGI